ncbi:MAG: hypothetical protein AB2556_23200, partial [Candidatus Thiodiazotropha sp.]
SMGLWTEKSLATHLLLENAYESNLLPDISRGDCLAGHKEQTHLQPLEGLPVFVDDIYVYGYLRKDLQRRPLLHDWREQLREAGCGSGCLGRA